MREEFLTEVPDPAVEAAWGAEIRERIRAFRAGEMKAIPIEQVLEEAERLLADGSDQDDADR